MNRDLKHVVIYGAFGLLLGAKIVEVLLTRTDTGIMDWWLLLVGVGAAVVHYLPVTDKSNPRDDQKSADNREQSGDTLVLRDYSDLERRNTPTRHHQATGRGES